MKILSVVFVLRDDESDAEFYEEQLPKDRILKYDGMQYANVIGLGGVNAIASALEEAAKGVYKDSVKILHKAGITNENNEVLPEVIEQAKKDLEQKKQQNAQAPKTTEQQIRDFNDTTVPDGTVFH